MNIRTSVEGKRGCGYRKEGGLYLVSDGEGRYCGALPIPLDVCPTCHHGIKPSRGWTWVDLQALRNNKPCVQTRGPNYCDGCAFFSIKRAGLIWVGEKYYKSPREFTVEASRMGISRRITAVPKGFEIGKDWVALAHRNAIQADPIPVEDKKGQVSFELQFKPGIFHLFVPRALEYVVKPNDKKEKLAAMEKRGISLVKVVRKEEKEAA